jgi:hypothetical protein
VRKATDVMNRPGVISGQLDSSIVNGFLVDENEEVRIAVEPAHLRLQEGSRSFLISHRMTREGSHQTPRPLPGEVHEIVGFVIHMGGVTEMGSESKTHP